MKPASFLIAVVAGFASALLFAGLVLQSSSAVSFALAAPIPIAIASLGWGSAAGFVSAVTAALTIYAVTQSVASAVTLFVAMALPMAIAGHLAGLARPVADAEAGPAPHAADDGARSTGFPPRRTAQTDRPALHWYPIERILAALIAMAILACVLIGWLLGYDPNNYVSAIVEALRESGGASVQDADTEQLRHLAQVVIDLVPFVQPAVLLLTLVVGLYIGAWATRLSDRLPRPKDDLPTATSLAQTWLAVFAVALLCTFIGGPAGLVADVVVGALAAGFALVGLAALHRRSRGRPGRGLLLFTSYAAILLLSFPIAIFVGLGLFETYRRPRRAS